MKKIIVNSLLFTFLFISKSIAQPGGEKKGWPSVERAGFITECVTTAKANMSEDAAKYYCYCMQEKVETKYPAIEEAAKITSSDMQSPEWQRDINSCLKGTWGAKDRSKFITECIASSSEGVGAEKAKTYCECMLFKIEVRFPDPADADKLTAEKLSTPEWKKIIQGCLDF